MRESIYGFLDAIEGVESLDRLRDKFSEFIAGMGFSSFAYVGLHLPPHHLPEPLVVSTYPDEWQAHYIQADLDKIDPVLTQCMRNLTPFKWDVVSEGEHISKRQETFFHDAKDLGLVYGLTVPIHGYGAEFGLLSITTNATENDFHDATSEFLHDIHIAALYYHAAIKKNLDEKWVHKEQFTLTAREMECTGWAAQGKTSWETSEILNISENTVNFHIKNVMRKLGVYSKQHAIVKAIMFGLICP